MKPIAFGPPARAFALALALCVVTLLASSCADDPTGPPANVTGTYVLESIGGQALPAILYYEGDTPILESWGGLRVFADSTYFQTDIHTTSERIGGYVGFRGTWTRSQDELQLTSPIGPPLTALVTRTGLEVAWPEGRAVYRRAPY